MKNKGAAGFFSVIIIIALFVVFCFLEDSSIFYITPFPFCIMVCIFLFIGRMKNKGKEGSEETDYEEKDEESQDESNDEEDFDFDHGEVEREEKYYCAYCGSELRKDEKKCSSCGASKRIRK